VKQDENVLAFESNALVPDFPTQLYIREEYTSITKLIESAIATKEFSRFLILGNAGIGKTYYLNYLYYYLSNAGKRVIIQKRNATKNVILFMLFNGQVCL
jgi:hypothetical protein